MKKLILIFAVVLTTYALASCDSSNDVIVDSKRELPNDELAKLYNSIDSLHNEYSDYARSSVLDKWARRFLVATVDACVGAITAETGPGAFVCSTIASGLYDDYLDAVNKKFGKPALTRSSETVLQTVVFPTTTPYFVDSIGYYHNLVINEIKSEGRSFTDRSGNIDYSSYYNVVIAVAQKNGISCNSTINKPLVFGYLNSIIKPFTQLQEGDEETILSIIFNETYNEFKYDNAKTLELRNIYKNIIYNDLSISEDKVAEYGTKVNDLIEKSQVPLRTKETMKIANNIAVNSSLYWSTN